MLRKKLKRSLFLLAFAEKSFCSIQKVIPPNISNFSKSTLNVFCIYSQILFDFLFLLFDVRGHCIFIFLSFNTLYPFAYNFFHLVFNAEACFIFIKKNCNFMSYCFLELTTYISYYWVSEKETT